MGRPKTPRRHLMISIPAHQALLRSSALTRMTLKELMETLIDDYLPDLTARIFMEARPDIDWKQKATAAEIGNLLTRDAPWRWTKEDTAKTLRVAEKAAEYRRNTN
jgi:hypothetical protein